MPKAAIKFDETRLGITLQQIAYDVVNAMGYVGAMVATYEEGDALPVRAVYLDPELATRERLQKWEERISQIIRRPVSVTNLDPDFARVYIHQEKYKDNLSVQAVKKRQPVVSDDLFSLFTPIIPAPTKPIIKLIQQTLGIKQVVAVPFFLEAADNGEPEIVGNLFAIKNSPITPQDILVLTAFGRQGAAAIEIERHRLQVLQVAKQLTTAIQARIREEQEILQQIVEGVVTVLGYVGAMVATYEADGSLPVRAVYFDQTVATAERIASWEKSISQIIRRPIQINNLDPNFARVYVHQEKYKDNLSVQAVQARRPVVSDDLFTLFTPILPTASRPIFNHLIQRALGIKQVIAVPFFIEMPLEGESEIVGNLFAATTRARGFKREEIELLQAFGQQAAGGIRNARLYREVQELYTQSNEQRQQIEGLYRKAEERREVAEVFGKMAFSAATNVHALRNHIGAFRTFFQILLMYRNHPEKLQEMLQSGSRYMQRLNDAALILENLHEPWSQQSDKPVDVNLALERAIAKVNDRFDLDGNIVIQTALAADLPPVKTSAEMLVETFHILLKNGIEAILEKHMTTADAAQGRKINGEPGVLRVESHCLNGEVIEVLVTDNGLGIAPENLDHIFELRWSTKETGLGFGLFWLKDYVEGLGGLVEVRSILGAGSTFCLTLPAGAPDRQ